jgi:hypothetical protein
MNRMLKTIAGLLIICLSVTLTARPSGAKSMQQGKDVVIEKQVVIEANESIELKPGTKLIFPTPDSKLTIKGKLKISGTEKEPSIIVIPNLLTGTDPIPVRQETLLKLDPNLRELEIYPYQVDTDEVVDELRAFRYQYAFVWTVLMAINFYLVMNKTEYW